MDEYSEADIVRSLRDKKEEIIKILERYGYKVDENITLEEIKKIFHPEEVVEEERESKIYVCSKCRSRKIRSEQHQIRATDEGATTMHFCTDCGHRWND